MKRKGASKIYFTIILKRKSIVSLQPPNEINARFPFKMCRKLDRTDRTLIVHTELQVTAEERQRLAGWLATQGTCEATDSCDVRPYALCSHGEPSWFMALGLI